MRKLYYFTTEYEANNILGSGIIEPIRSNINHDLGMNRKEIKDGTALFVSFTTSGDWNTGYPLMQNLLGNTLNRRVEIEVDDYSGLHSVNYLNHLNRSKTGKYKGQNKAGKILNAFRDKLKRKGYSEREIQIELDRLFNENELRYYGSYNLRDKDYTVTDREGKKISYIKKSPGGRRRGVSKTLILELSAYVAAVLVISGRINQVGWERNVADKFKSFFSPEIFEQFLEAVKGKSKDYIQNIKLFDKEMYVKHKFSAELVHKEKFAKVQEWCRELTGKSVDQAYIDYQREHNLKLHVKAIQELQQKGSTRLRDILIHCSRNEESTGNE